MTGWSKPQKAELDSSSESVSCLVWAASDEDGFSSATTAASTSTAILYSRKEDCETETVFTTECIWGLTSKC